MKFTLSWLKEFLDTDADLKAITDTLTMIGLELEGLDNPAETYAAFKVCYVEKAEQHTNADRLRVCDVKTADGNFQVVCGAPNARTGMKGIFAPEGSYIPGTDMVLKKGVIRDVESCGMLVSEREMNLSDEHDGIIEVDEKFEVGTPMAEVFGLNDPVIEINLTPNRADCAGIYGIARDLAAAGLGTLKSYNADKEKGTFESPVKVTIEDKDGCPLFLGRTFKNIKNGPSPDWLQRQLKAVGLRPISALVDITNYMTLSYARPLHVYDVAKLQGNIAVKKDQGGTEVEALNDKTYTIDGATCAICDDRGPIGIGGIVGGVSTGCEEDTNDVFLEGAYFSPMRIARTGRDLGIESDARYRFERGVDPNFTFDGIEIATRLILEICGTDKTEISEVVQAGETPQIGISVDYDPAYVERLMGYSVAADVQQKILEDLGFQISGKLADGKTAQVTAPSWRGDVFGKADLVEEVCRIDGFDKLPAVSVTKDKTEIGGTETLTGSRMRKARIALAAKGMEECVTWSFMNQDLASHFGSNDNDALQLTNPINAEMDQMRPSILPHLIEAALRNADRGYKDTALFEVGPTFQSNKPDGQSMIAAGIRANSVGDRHWTDQNATRVVDAYDVKADAMQVLEACGAQSASVQITRDAPDYYHPGRSGALRQGKNILAVFGEIHPAVLDEMGVKSAALSSVCGFEVFVQNIPEGRKKGTAKKLLKLAALQPITRDFAFIVDQDVEAENIVKAAAAADKKLITDAQVFDVYQGKGVEEGKKSVALAITIQPTDKTLTDEEIEELSQKVIDMVGNKAGGILRG